MAAENNNNAEKTKEQRRAECLKIWFPTLPAETITALAEGYEGSFTKTTQCAQMLVELQPTLAALTVSKVVEQMIADRARKVFVPSKSIFKSYVCMRNVAKIVAPMLAKEVREHVDGVELGCYTECNKDSSGIYISFKDELYGALSVLFKTPPANEQPVVDKSATVACVVRALTDALPLFCATNDQVVLGPFDDHAVVAGYFRDLQSLSDGLIETWTMAHKYVGIRFRCAKPLKAGIVYTPRQDPVLQMLTAAYPYTPTTTIKHVVEKLWGDAPSHVQYLGDIRAEVSQTLDLAWVCSVAGQFLRAMPVIKAVSQELMTKEAAFARFDDIPNKTLLVELWKTFETSQLPTIKKLDQYVIFVREPVPDLAFTTLVDRISANIHEKGEGVVVPVPFPISKLPDLHRVRDALPFLCYLAIVGQDEVSTSILVVPDH